MMDPAPTVAPFNTMAPIPMRHLVFQRAAVEHGEMADSDSIPNQKREIRRIAVENTVVLHIRFFADADDVHVAAHYHSRPDAGSLADNDVADHLCTRIDVSGSGDLRKRAAIGANHACSVVNPC